MFNGIIKHTGKIKNISKNNNNCSIEILSKIKFSKLGIIHAEAIKWESIKREFLAIFHKTLSAYEWLTTAVGKPHDVVSR